ncbi:MAG: endonuclease/exonuclease/phosphatase family protein [Alphaproteobacteria bacterium]|nr:endonuclease/exonuclease/phosphatase family protein [Alphaproteobacteria bacterium]
MSRVRFLCFNIHGGRSLDGKRDLSRIHALMERLDIDIGVFQEMETRSSRGGTTDSVSILAGDGRPHHLHGASLAEGKGWYGNLIVSRHPILRGLVHNLETAPSLEPRNAVDALIDTPLGILRVIGTHLSLSLLERWSEAQNLLRLIQAVEEKERHPLFLMGDINEWQWPSRLLRYLNRAMTPLSCKSTFPSLFPVLKLDRAWYDAPGIKAVAHRLGDRQSRLLSDHLPLIIEIEK